MKRSDLVSDERETPVDTLVSKVLGYVHDGKSVTIVGKACSQRKYDVLEGVAEKLGVESVSDTYASRASPLDFPRDFEDSGTLVLYETHGVRHSDNVWCNLRTPTAVVGADNPGSAYLYISHVTGNSRPMPILYVDDAPPTDLL